MADLNPDLLRRHLELLIEQWGGDSVRATLLDIGRGKPASTRDRIEAVRKRARRAVALEQIERAKLDARIADPIRDLAKRYDAKLFLPTVPDVREFLMMLQVRPPAMKDRSEAFSKLLPVLIRLPADRLEAIRQDPSFSGPSRLAPLSDAIGSAGKALDRQGHQ